MVMAGRKNNGMFKMVATLPLDELVYIVIVVHTVHN